MRTPVAGKVRSGVEVAQTTRSTSTGSMPARTSAWREAAIPRSEVSSPSSAMWRCSMPVRSRIQASLVSTMRDRSSLVMTRFGRWAPTPRITDRMMATASPLRSCPPGTPERPGKSNLHAAAALTGGCGLAGRYAQFAVQGLEVRCQPCQHVALGHLVAHLDGAGEAQRIGAAVALDGDAVEAEEGTAVEAAGVHAVAQGAQAALREHGPDLCRQRA